MSLFEKLSEYVLETSEQIIKVIEEGTALITAPAQGNDDGAGTLPPMGAFDGEAGEGLNEFPDFDGASADFMNAESPLNGIAEGVLNDIMKNQVRV